MGIKEMSDSSVSAAEGANGANLSCSMNGYRVLVGDILNLALLAITLNVSFLELVLSGAPDLAKAVELLYEFLKSAGMWQAYVVAAIYYFGLELGYGDLLCQISQYGYMVVYYLNVAITFGQNMS